MYQYQKINEDGSINRHRTFEKVSKQTNNLFIAIGILWVNMISKYFNMNQDEIPKKSLCLVIRRLWERENKKWGYDDFKDLFTYFLNSKIPEEDKISFDLCMSQKYVAKYKIAQKNKKHTFAEVSRELKL